MTFFTRTAFTRTFFARALVALSLAALVHPAALRAQSQDRTIVASVLDKAGAPVTGLSVPDFIVREDGMAREVLRVSLATEPLQIALLVDTSQAIDSYLLDLRQGVSAFVKEMQGKAEIALIGFGDRPTVLVDYTRDAARLDAGAMRIFASRDSGAYLLDAIVDASRGLLKRKAARPVIVAVVGNGPEFSERSHEMIVDELKESGATLHALVINRRGTAYNDRSGQELDASLSQGTERTGGRLDDLLTSMAITDRLRSLASELTHQYQVVYARTPTLIPPSAVEVQVKRPDAVVRARRTP